ncbi:CDP-glycerol glycerophosphotransferase family protein [Vagococcus lutrae]|uniref:CDP-glycerol glycerophosphotransferase family protein n=1 Tax=Vagococcus lutrae TaxID=81947 RepID=UPI002891873E|nr:CDP-glycerol glycerophosphotransferase family protein [Vagococcus lutrae]MDT2807394.1 CDP-glycerol glycerophosphotransferase family protein [Vagococcus lutrae]
MSEKQQLIFKQTIDGLSIKSVPSEGIDFFFLVFREESLAFKKRMEDYYLAYDEIARFLIKAEEGLVYFKCDTLYTFEQVEKNEPEQQIDEDDINYQKRKESYWSTYETIFYKGITYYKKTCNVGKRSFDIDVVKLKEIKLSSFLLHQEVGATKTLVPYIGMNQSIRFRLNRDVSHKKQYLAGQKIRKLKLKEQCGEILQQITLRNVTLDRYSIQLKSRNTAETVVVQGNFKLKKENHLKKSTFRSYEMTADIASGLFQFRHLSTIDSAKNQSDDIIDAYMLIEVAELDQPLLFRLGKPRFVVERFLKGQVYIEEKETVHDFVPYFTIKGNNLSFNYNQYSQEAYHFFKTITRSFIKKKNKKPIWIVGEKSYKAQDTGYHFFKYLRENQPNIDAYYVIDKQSKEYENVKPLGNILDFKSFAHFEKMVQADFICTSHHAEHIFPNRSFEMERRVKAKRVFLQHGVLGTKNLQTYYHKGLKQFNTDLFIVSSKREKAITTVDLGYDENQVLVTGISRFDALLDGKIAKKKQVLLIPTWREWITDSDKLLESEYFVRINNLLKKLGETDLEGYQVIFCVHPNMQPFLEYFEIPKGEKIIAVSQGERNVQDLMKESAIMITDYSSVGFDFSFLNRPVLYYQFDRDRFLGRYPSHLDLDNELPGFISSSDDAIIAKLKYFIDNNGQNDSEYWEKAQVFFAFNDRNSSQRIYEQVSNHRFSIRERISNKMNQEILFSFFQRKFRRSRYYYPTMKLYYRFLKTFTKRIPNLIVFESNVGKTVGDSPKAIYDELVKQKKDYQYVWISNHPTAIYQTDETIAVKRLSKDYYYYLAKAQYWVNNQNFPTYLKKPHDTTYLQTWHGTPLKKMQNDLKGVTGRDEGYLDRVNQAVANWDYLVSPSRYASEAFRSAFQFQKEILEVGYPRNDIFYQPEKWKNRIPGVRQQLGLELDERKIILYAPTFRDDSLKKGKAHFDQPIDLDEFYRQFGTEYILLIKPHIITGNRLSIPEAYRDTIKNVSSYDIQNLYLITDICITDYSSIMFDFANTRKPLLFFTYDIEHYRENLRGFYIDFESEAPGPLCMDNFELFEAIRHIDSVVETYQSHYQKFYEKYCGLEDGHAAEKIVKRLF